eukprot:8669259-Lingulodinium_polyedra.AAC.1
MTSSPTTVPGEKGGEKGLASSSATVPPTLLARSRTTSAAAAALAAIRRDRTLSCQGARLTAPSGPGWLSRTLRASAMLWLQSSWQKQGRSPLEFDLIKRDSRARNPPALWQHQHGS